MRSSWLILILICLSGLGASVTAQTVQPRATPVNPTSTPTASSATSDDDELKTQEKILAELRFLKAEKLGWVEQRKGLEGQLQAKDREIVVERERGDWFKKAAETAKVMDTNSQQMDKNAVFIQTTLESRLKDKNEQIADLSGRLNSCQNNQKWIAGISFVTGGVVGWSVKKQTDRFLPSFAMPQLQPLSQPAPQFRIYK